MKLSFQNVFPAVLSEGVSLFMCQSGIIEWQLKTMYESVKLNNGEE